MEVLEESGRSRRGFDVTDGPLSSADPLSPPAPSDPPPPSALLKVLVCRCARPGRSDALRLLYPLVNAEENGVLDGRTTPMLRPNESRLLKPEPDPRESREGRMIDAGSEHARAVRISLSSPRRFEIRSAN